MTPHLKLGERFGNMNYGYLWYKPFGNREVYAAIGDCGNIIYVNGQYRNLETPIGQLMHDFSCVDSSEIINPLLRDRVHYLKETEGGREKMCQIMENRINEEKIELAKKAIARGKLSLEEIAETLSLPLAFVQELARPKAAMV